jgi:hypothetical protein
VAVLLRMTQMLALQDNFLAANDCSFNNRLRAVDTGPARAVGTVALVG